MERLKDAVLVDMWFGNCLDPMRCLVLRQGKRLILRNAADARDVLAFSSWQGSQFKKRLMTWLRLSTVGSIPIGKTNVLWDISEQSPYTVRIKPDWPADFSIFLRCLNPDDYVRLGGHIELVTTGES